MIVSKDRYSKGPTSAFITYFAVKGRIFFSVCLLLTSAVVAADPVIPAGFNPGSVEPGVIGQGIVNSPSPIPMSPTPKFVLPHEMEPSTTNPSPEASKISFVLNGVVIKGNQVFTTSELQAIFQPYLHHKITVAMLQKLVQSITDKYQSKGYFLSKALLPPQEITGGVVKVTVVEGFISQIEVQGIKRKGLIKFIQKYGDKIKANKPIKLKTLERYLLLINDVPGFSVKSVLEPDPTIPLGAKLTLVTVQKPVQAALSYDNYQTPYLGPNESTLFTSLNSVFIPGGTLSGRVLSANKYRSLTFFELRHDQVIGTQGLVFGLDGYSTRTNPQFILTPLEVFGMNSDANATLTYPLIRTRQRTLSIQGQFDYMSGHSTALGQQLYNDQIRDVAFSTLYNDTLWKGEDIINLFFDKGFNGLGVNKNAVWSRKGASSDFFRIVGTFSREQHFNEHFSLYGYVTAQYSNKILPSAINFTFGGPYLGRGYDWAQFTNDEGIAGKVEFRMNTTPNFPFLKQVQYYAFYDVGRLWSLIPAVSPTSGASAGFGFRAALMKHFNAEAFVGKPLTTPNASQIAWGDSGHSFLGFFQVSAYI